MVFTWPVSCVLLPPLQGLTFIKNAPLATVGPWSNVRGVCGSNVLIQLFGSPSPDTSVITVQSQFTGAQLGARWPALVSGACK